MTKSPRLSLYDDPENYPGFDLWLEMTPDDDDGAGDYFDIIIDYGSVEGKVDPFANTKGALQHRVSLTLAELAWITEMAPTLFGH